jgi:hypothetical protein
LLISCTAKSLSVSEVFGASFGLLSVDKFRINKGFNGLCNGRLHERILIPSRMIDKNGEYFEESAMSRMKFSTEQTFK